MLAPETRVLLTDALRPPDGYRVDLTVATTYSLDLTALLLAPMTFALHENDTTDIDAVDGIALLESLRRYAGSTTVFCQAGGIHLPPRYSPLLQFIESSVIAVTPRTRGRVFHPKVWAIRFSAPDLPHLHRVLVLSRNLTFDRSWDTLLRLDEGSGATPPDTAPLVDFLRALPGLAVAPVDPDRARQIEDMISTIGAGHFDVPRGFQSLRFLPIGLGATQWPFPSTADRALLISPFLDVTATRRVLGTTSRVDLLSRSESLDGIAEIVAGTRMWTFQRPAEIEVGDDAPDVTQASNERTSVRDGLHAKTFVFDSGGSTTVLTGSANLTSAAFGGNVEFDVVMTGPVADAGVDSVWEGSAESPGLSRLVEPYSPRALSEQEQARAALELEVDRLQTDLAAKPWRLNVRRVDGDTVDLRVDLELVDRVADTKVWPISLPRLRARLLSDRPEWEGVNRGNITPFLAVETTLTVEAMSATARMVIKAELIGDVGDRRTLAMSDVLRRPEDVLRYLALLLADPSFDIGAAGGSSADPGSGWERRSGLEDLVVLEPLVRASVRSDDAMKRVANLMAELKTMDGGDNLLPAGFSQIWNAVWSAREAK